MARPRGFDEKQVLNAVRDQFWNAGYAATSLEDLMRVSGLGKGSLYAAFGDKRRLSSGRCAATPTTTTTTCAKPSPKLRGPWSHYARSLSHRSATRPAPANGVAA